VCIVFVTFWLGLCTSAKGRQWIASEFISRNGLGHTDCSTLRFREYALPAIVSLLAQWMKVFIIIAHAV
jgi:hypothetical protein